MEHEQKLTDLTTTTKKTKKKMMTKPKLPDIDLGAIFKDFISLLQSEAKDLHSIGLSGEVRSQRWALSIINLIYLHKTKKDTEDYAVSEDN